MHEVIKQTGTQYRMAGLNPIVVGLTVLIALVSTACATANPEEPSSAEETTTTTIPGGTSAGVIDAQPTTVVQTPVEEVAIDDSNLPLFAGGIGEVGVAFDIVNADLAESFGFPRIDITEIRLQGPTEAEGSGPFAAEIVDAGILGGQVVADRSVEVVVVMIDPAAPRAESAMLTTVAMTIDATEANLAAYEEAVALVSTGPIGTASYFTSDGRGVLVERIPTPGGGSDEWLSLTVAGATDEATAASLATQIRDDVIGRLNR